MSRGRRIGLGLGLGLGLGACTGLPSQPPHADAGVDAGVDAGIDASTDAPPHACTHPFLGDPSQPPVVEAVGLGPDMTNVPINDGGPVTLAFPPQGGRVVFAGVRATNLDPCAVQITGAIRNLATNHAMFDSRTVNLVPSGDGWGASDPREISTFSNVPVCPNEWSDADLYGVPYGLELTVIDRGGRTAEKKIDVVPACSEPAHAAECLCICRAGYVLGESCMDGGTDAADDSSAEGGS